MYPFHKCYLCGARRDLYPQINNKKSVVICGECLKKEYVKTTKVVKNKKKSSNWNDIVSPETMNDFIGQKPIKTELITMLEATKKHHIIVQHCLFSGSFGLGKTTIAKIFGSMISKDWSIVNASNIASVEDLPSSKVVVVDEIHTIKDEEWLLTVMDSGDQTILGATTTAGRLSGPLRSRFVSLILQPYEVPDLELMVKSASSNLKYDCPDYVANSVAVRGKTVARNALFLFKRVYDRIILNNGVTPELLENWFEAMKIDADGLDNADRAYVNCLDKTRPIGLQNLSAMTGLDKITLEETIEPYLLTKGFLKRTARGRLLGDKEVINVW